MESTNKKRTAVAAVATAAALVLTGTFAWVMKEDQTELNKFTAKDPGTYEVELKEDFDPNNPWANKDVWVENKGDNPVIVRVRLEEFYDLEYRDGTTYNIKKGYSQGSDNGSAIFKVPGGSELADDLTADSSTGIDKNVILKFGENGTGVTTMEKWNAMEADAKAAVKWVIDTDGWCYYTKALLYGEKTSYLLDDVDFNEALFLESHSKPYNLDYKINVRLQAISADLEDFGGSKNDMQWTNTDYINDQGETVVDTANAGRIIADDPTNDYEILADSTITNEAMALVTGISYDFATMYTGDFKNADGSVAKRVSTARALLLALYDKNVHSILLTDNIEVTLGDSSIYGYPYLPLTDDRGNKMIDLGEYTLKCSSSPLGLPLFYVDDATGSKKLSIKHGNIELNNIALYGTNNTSDMPATSLELVGVNVTGATNLVARGAALKPGSEVKIFGSHIETTDEVMSISDDMDVLVSDSQLISRTQSVFPLNGNQFDDSDPKRVNITLETRSTDPEKRTLIKSMSTNSGAYAIWAGEDWTINAKNVTIEAVEKAITENHECGAPKEVNLTGCTLNSREIGYYKVTDSPLKMKDCEVNVTSENDKKALGLFLRSGDITLDNVNVSASQGTTGKAGVEGPFVRSSSYDTLDEYYSNETGACAPNYEALQIVLNSYEDINLNIIGGSYKTNVAGANSVYVFDATTGNDGGRLHNKNGEYKYHYNNNITLTGTPEFTPATLVFDQTYAHTTINK
ncbi:MAG: hypothetical protein ACI4FO_01775 [Acutalibacteraceae bacterium]